MPYRWQNHTKVGQFVDGYSHKELAIYSVADGVVRYRHHFDGAEEKVSAVAFSADGRSLALTLNTFEKGRSFLRFELWDTGFAVRQ
jgi:hypothetical protein